MLFYENKYDIYLISKSLSVSEFTPTANTLPSGSNAVTGLPITLMCNLQLDDLRSHNLKLLSNEPDINISFNGDTQRETTCLVCPEK